MEMPVSRWMPLPAEIHPLIPRYPIAPATWQRLQGFVESFQPLAGPPGRIGAPPGGCGHKRRGGRVWQDC